MAANLTEEISKLNVNLWTDAKPTDTAAANDLANVRRTETYIHTCINFAISQAYYIHTS